MTKSVAASRSRAHRDLLRIYAAAVSAADPRRVVARALDGVDEGGAQVPETIAQAAGIRLIAVGKAARGMATEAIERLGERILDGVVIGPKVAAWRSGGSGRQLSGDIADFKRSTSTA